MSGGAGNSCCGGSGTSGGTSLSLHERHAILQREHTSLQQAHAALQARQRDSTGSCLRLLDELIELQLQGKGGATADLGGGGMRGGGGGGGGGGPGSAIILERLRELLSEPGDGAIAAPSARGSADESCPIRRPFGRSTFLRH